MAAHDEILRAALVLCRRRRGWRFRPVEIVRALPHLEPGTVRTHIVSRCCLNAPKNHPHKWDYFRRVARAVYEIRPAYRRIDASRKSRKRSVPRSSAVAERRAGYGREREGARRDTIHAVVRRSEGSYVGECLEVAVVTQGRTLDELVTNLQDAIALHLDGEDLQELGLAPEPRLAITYELAAAQG